MKRPHAPLTLRDAERVMSMPRRTWDDETWAEAEGLLAAERARYAGARVDVPSPQTAPYPPDAIKRSSESTHRPTRSTRQARPNVEDRRGLLIGIIAGLALIGVSALLWELQ